MCQMWFLCWEMKKKCVICSKMQFYFLSSLNWKVLCVLLDTRYNYKEIIRGKRCMVGWLFIDSFFEAYKFKYLMINTGRGRKLSINLSIFAKIHKIPIKVWTKKTWIKMKTNDVTLSLTYSIELKPIKIFSHKWHFSLIDFRHKYFVFIINLYFIVIVWNVWCRVREREERAGREHFIC